jgi:hypothetical protein
MELSAIRFLRMETSADVATWLSFMVTAVGLGGLLSQASAINEKLDPFHSHRTPAYLGFWYGHQEKASWWTVRKPPLYGPVLVADLETGFCGRQIIHLTRLPLFTPPGKAGWALILAIFHPEKLLSLRSTSLQIDTELETGAHNGNLWRGCHSLATKHTLVYPSRERHS